MTFPCWRNEGKIELLASVDFSRAGLVFASARTQIGNQSWLGVAAAAPEVHRPRTAPVRRPRPRTPAFDPLQAMTSPITSRTFIAAGHQSLNLGYVTVIFKGENWFVFFSGKLDIPVNYGRGILVFLYYISPYVDLNCHNTQLNLLVTTKRNLQ